MNKERFDAGLATMIGSMPHHDPGQACETVFKYLPEIPAWPQLPKRASVENMSAPFIEGFPGLKGDGERVWVDRSQDLSAPLEKLYAAALDEDTKYGEISAGVAQGLYTFLARAQQPVRRPPAVKGQVTGPVSLGLLVTDQDRRPLLYDPTFADALAKHLRLKAAWQEHQLKAVCPRTIIFLDEPYMSSFGSAFLSILREQVVTLFNEVFSGLKGLKGVHCCGNTDWSVMLETSLDILNLDAYNYGQTLALYPAEVKAFLERGGVIAWGIVPTEEQALAGESVASLRDRLEETMGLLCRKGLEYDMLRDRCLLTPSCGLGSLSIEAAERALELLSGLSAEVRKK